MQKRRARRRVIFDIAIMVCNDKSSVTPVPCDALRPGRFSCNGAGEPMRPGRGDGFLRTDEAARLVGVSPATIRSWRNRGWLEAQGLDERDRPLHTKEAVRAAERLVRENSMRTSGIDPRQLRGRNETPRVFPEAA
jgi:hypothetical protein